MIAIFEKNMMPHSNEYDTIPICRTHARSLCEKPQIFDACVHADKRQFLSLVARVVASCAYTPKDVFPPSHSIQFNSIQFFVIHELP